jgi:glyoxylase-like metal-dependent hydrolase (beta-lactamase superfamily II)
MSNDIRVIELGFVNAYLLKAGDGYVMIDTGLPFQWDMLERELQSAGCVPGSLKVVLITHGDWDHAGNVLRLRDKYKVKLAMHSGDVNQVEKGVFLKRKVRPLAHRILFTARMMLRNFQKDKMSFPKFTPDILLSDGQSLQEYGINAKVIHLPGHTPGSIGILTDTGDLFSGDTFVNRKKPDSANIIENEAALRNSLDRVKKMNVKMVYPGHGKPFVMERLHRQG